MASLRRLLVLVILLGLVLVSGSPLAPQASAQVPAPTVSDVPVRLPGHTVAVLSRATKVARAAGAITTEPPVTLTVVLKRTDEAGFQRFLADVEDPHSANHGKFLSQDEITKRFGPSPQAYDETVAYLQQQGLTLVEGSANRLTLTVKGTRTQVEHAFSVQIGDYQLGNRSFYANDQDPLVPGSMAQHIQAVAGLSNLAQPQPNHVYDDIARKCTSDPALDVVCGFVLAGGVYILVCATVNPICLFALPVVLFAGGLFIGRGISTALGSPPPSPQGGKGQTSGSAATQQSLTGAGQKIGLLEFDGFHRSDVSDWLALLQRPAAQIGQQMALLSEKPVNGGVTAPGPNEAEVLLDIDMVMGLAPGANVVVYDAPGNTSFQTMFNAMINDGDTVISNSWSYCEDQTSLADVQSLDAIFANASASGVSIVNASGDSGSTCLDGNPNTVSVPADSPHATAVGGTTGTLGTGFTYGAETWWDGSHATPPTGQGGFGVSRFFPRPAYQNGLTTATMRSVPDVVALADPQNGLPLCQADAGGCPDGKIHGGTSMAAPEWAAYTAILNQSQGHNVGNLNTLLYPLANTNSFHTPASMGSDFAHVGLGSPNLDRINLALAGTVAGPGSATASQVVPLPTAASADGSAIVVVQVNLRDANGHLVSGKNVSLSANGGTHAVISAASGPSSVNDGAVLFTVKDSTIEDVTFTATDTTDGVAIQQTATVRFVSPAATAAGIAASPTSVAADGATASTITVTLKGANGQGVSGKTVTLSQGNGHSIINGPTPATTDANGQVTFAATDIQTETVSYTAVDVTDGNLPVPGSATVSFTSGVAVCDSGTATAATGYAFTPFATGFNSPSGCGGPTGVAFDSAGNLFVVNIRTGFLYKFGPQGGIADTATQLNTTPIPNFPEGLAFGKDGKLYLSRLTGNDVWEINPTTGAYIRTVATGLNQPLGLAIDPLSGDLFVNQNLSPDLIRIANPASASPTMTVYASPGDSDGLAVAPDGTFFSATFQTSSVTRIAGTNAPSPGAVTVVTNVPNSDGIAVAVNAGVPAFLFVNRTDGIITKVDLGTTPPTKTDIFTGGSRGDFAAVDPDGCFYATQSDRVIKVTNADGTCPFAPTSASPQLGLSPASVIPNPPTGTPVTFTATLRNVPSPAGTTVTFTVTGANPQTKLVQADASGVASFTYTGAHTGADTVTATATASATALTANPVAVTWAPGKDVTFLSLNLSVTSGSPNTTKTLTASLTDVSHTPPTPISGATLTISLGGQSCTATTGSDGVGSCSVTLTGTPGSYPLVASYAGTSQYTASTATASFSVTNLPPSGLQFYPLSAPVRLLDTRPGQQGVVHPGTPLTANQALSLPGQFSSGGVSVPAGAQALVGNATVDNTVGAPAGFATLYPSGSALPLASNLNFVPGTVRPNAFTVGLGSDGKFNLLSNTGGNFVIDITGYYAPPGTGGLFFHPLSQPVRLLDTRAGQSAVVHPNAALTAGQTLTLPGPFTANGITVPSSAKALAGNATVDNTVNAPAGFATLFPGGGTLPPTSNLNFVPGTVAPNAFTVGLGADGSFNLYSNTGGNFILDITGYYDTVGVGGLLFYSLTQPVRELDTRAGQAAAVHPGAPLGAKGTLNLPGSFTFSGVTVPGDAKALVGNATVDNSINAPDGFATLFPGGTSLPLASNLNFSAGTVAPNAFTVGLGGDGSFNLYSNTGGNFILDISGYFAAGTGTSTASHA